MKFNTVAEYQEWLKSREVVQPKVEPKPKKPRAKRNTTKDKKED